MLTLERRFVDREEWKRKVIEMVAKGSVDAIPNWHIHGIGGVGKSAFLEHIDQIHQRTIRIQCSTREIFDTRLHSLFVALKKDGQVSLPRFTILWAIKRRLKDGIDLPKESDGWPKWIIDIVSLLSLGIAQAGTVKILLDKLPRLTKIVDGISKAIAKGNKPAASWIEKRLGGRDWILGFLPMLFENHTLAVNHILTALQTDLNETNKGRYPIVLLIDGLENAESTKQWKIKGIKAAEPELWHHLAYNTRNMILVSCGRESFDEKTCRSIGIEQSEMEVFEKSSTEDAPRMMCESRGISDGSLQDLVIQVSKGHPFLMDLICDGIAMSVLQQSDLSSLASMSLRDTRVEVWRSIFSRIGNLKDLVNRAAILPYISKNSMQIVCRSLDESDWSIFTKLSFVKQGEKPEEYRIHFLARELALFNMSTNLETKAREVEEALLQEFKKTIQDNLLGPALSATEHVSIEYAKNNISLFVKETMRDRDYSRIITALEGTEFRDHTLMGIRCYQLGLTYSDLEFLGLAEDLYLQASTYLDAELRFEEKRYIFEIGALYNSRGMLYLKLGRHNLAIADFNKALDILNELEKQNPGAHEMDISGVLANIGWYHLESCDYPESKKSYEASIGRFESYDDQDGLIEILLNFATACRLNEDLVDARLALERTLSIIDSSEIETLRLEEYTERAHSELGVVFTELARKEQDLKIRRNLLREAVKHYVIAVEKLRNFVTASELYFKPKLVKTLHNFGNFLLFVKNYEQAREVYSESLTLGEEIQTRRPGNVDNHIASTLFGLGTVEKNLGEFDRAVSLMARAIAILKHQSDYLTDDFLNMRNQIERSLIGILIDFLGLAPEDAKVRFNQVVDSKLKTIEETASKNDS